MRRRYPKDRFGRFNHLKQAEKIVGGEIKEGHIVHHIDGNIRNYRKDNLVILKEEDHKAFHKVLKIISKFKGKYPVWERKNDRY